jgi:DNA anti-recombination protein RmuC
LASNFAINSNTNTNTNITGTSTEQPNEIISLLEEEENHLQEAMKRSLNDIFQSASSTAALTSAGD